MRSVPRLVTGQAEVASKEWPKWMTRTSTSIAFGRAAVSGKPPWRRWLVGADPTVKEADGMKAAKPPGLDEHGLTVRGPTGNREVREDKTAPGKSSSTRTTRQRYVPSREAGRLWHGDAFQARRLPLKGQVVLEWEPPPSRLRSSPQRHAQRRDRGTVDVCAVGAAEFLQELETSGKSSSTALRRIPASRSCGIEGLHPLAPASLSSRAYRRMPQTTKDQRAPSLQAATSEMVPDKLLEARGVLSHVHRSDLGRDVVDFIPQTFPFRQ